MLPLGITPKDFALRARTEENGAAVTRAQRSDGAVQARLDVSQKSPALAVDVPDYRKTPA